jgi:hypothetical protein
MGPTLQDALVDSMFLSLPGLVTISAAAGHSCC